MKEADDGNITTTLDINCFFDKSRFPDALEEKEV
jgi:hypothetical protein